METLDFKALNETSLQNVIGNMTKEIIKAMYGVDFKFDVDLTNLSAIMKEQADSKIRAFGEEHNHSFVQLGFVILEQDVCDEEGNVLTEAVYGDKYMIDVCWINLEQDEEGNIDHPYGWKSYAIDIDSEGIHSFYGLKYQDLKIQ